MFTADELRVLQTFSERFRSNLDLLGDADLTLQQLQERPEWQAVLADAQAASAEFERAKTRVPSA
jgi:hypothetical protein